MGELRDLAPHEATSAQLARASATLTAEAGGTLGPWWLQAANIQEWIAESDSAHPFGRVRLSAAGWAQINLDDMPGWHPFATLAGLDAGRRVQLTTRYGFDGTILEQNMPMTYDGTLERHYAVGPVSDGTLASAALRPRILVAPIDGADWQLDDLVFGWVQLAE